MGSQDETIQRHLQHWAHKTQDEGKQAKPKQHNYNTGQHEHD